MSRKRIAIVQSSYIPWKGYFDLIRASDEFMLLDDVQFTRRDWRTRNRIKTPQGSAWLTIPVQNKGRYLQTIRETRIADGRWSGRHWAALRANYARAAFFREYAPAIEAVYRELEDEEGLSVVNYRLMATICGLLGVSTPITWSSDYTAAAGRTARLVSLCQQAGATEYLSGPTARSYIDLAMFDAAGITVRFADYEGYPEYAQLYPPFDHQVTVLDLLFSTGPGARQYLKDL